MEADEWNSMKPRHDSYANWFTGGKSRVEQSLKQFTPAALSFAVVFILFRVYEFVLLRGQFDIAANIAALEFGSIGYDIIFSFALIAPTLIIHIALSTISQRLAYYTTASIFTILLILNFCSIQYFVNTLTPLSLTDLGEQVLRLSTMLHATGGMNWTTITPLMVMIPLVIAGFSALREFMPIHRLPLIATMLLCASMINLAWFLPKSPPPGKFQGDLEYHVATNKTYLLLSEVFDQITERKRIDITFRAH